MNSRQVAVCSWSLHPSSPQDLVSKVQECGLKNIQLALNPLAMQPAWEKTQAIFEDAGINILSGMLEAKGEDYTTLETIAQTGGVRPDETWPATWERATQVASIASDFGLSLVTFHAGFLPDESCKERTTMIERLGAIVSLFADQGVELAFETGQETATNLISVIEEIDHATLGVNFDPANMILYGQGDPIEAVQALKPWIKQVHIKDAKYAEVEGTWGNEVPTGMGDFCWKTFLDCIPEDINLVIEREGGENRIEDVTGAYSMLQELIAC